MVDKNKIKLVLFDGDGTSWHYPVGEFGSSWDALFNTHGVFSQAQALIKYYYPRKELYEEWAKKQSAFFRGLRVSHAIKYMHPIPYSPGFRDFIAHVTGKIKTGLLTGGLDITARKVQEECGLDFCLCNELVQKKGIYTGECNLKVHLWKKLELFQDFLKENNFSPENVCYVGDTKGDIACMNYAGLGVAHNPKDEETKKAIPKERTTENHMELVEIIELFEEK